MRIGCAGWLLMSGTLSGALGCGDPQPPPARLAMNIELSGCSIDGKFGLPEESVVLSTLQANIPQSQLEALPRLVDGDEGTSVSCSVTETSANQFSFSASAALGGARSFTLSSGVTTGPTGTAAATGTAVATFRNTQTIRQRSGSCSVTAAIAPTGGGALLLEFECADFAAEDTTESTRCFASGTVVIDRCSK